MPDSSKRHQLIETITTQPEHDEGRALVTMAEFFDGNDDLSSIGCNLSDHPGLDVCERTLKAIEEQRDVSEVWLQIYDTDESEWPFSENVLIFGSITAEDAKSLTLLFGPSAVDDLTMDWTPTRKPGLAGERYVNLWWD